MIYTEVKEKVKHIANRIRFFFMLLLGIIVGGIAYNNVIKIQFFKEREETFLQMIKRLWWLVILDIITIYLGYYIYINYKY